MADKLALVWACALAVKPAEQPPMKKIAVTVSEATELSGLGRSSIYKLFNEGKLTPRKSGKRTLILVSDLEDYLQSLPVAA